MATTTYRCGRVSVDVRRRNDRHPKPLCSRGTALLVCATDENQGVWRFLFRLVLSAWRGRRGVLVLGGLDGGAL